MTKDSGGNRNLAMVMVSKMEHSNRTCTVSRGYTYSYIYIKPEDVAKPYVLFLHGFPSIPADHHVQIEHLSNLGYGIIAPELLGYGDTSHPSNADAYRIKPMTQDVVDILDHHSITCVLGVGHDFGVFLLSRLEFYHPDRVSKMVLEAIGCPPFGQSFDVDMVNNMMKSKLGYEGYGYMVFFTRDPDAPHLINHHQDSFRSLIFSPNVEVCKQYFGSIGGMKQWLEDDRQVETVQGFTEKLRQAHEVAFNNDKGGYAATLNWYRNHVFQKNVPDERAELERRGISEYRIDSKIPVLLLLVERDPIAVAAIHKEMTEPYAPHVQVDNIDAGHWLILEDAKNVAQKLEDFFGA